MPSEPFSAAQVVSICRDLYDQSGFSDWRSTNELRRMLRHREQSVDIQGIAQMLEDRSPAIEVNCERYTNRLDASEINISVTARGKEPAALEAAQRVENFYYALYYDWKRRRSAKYYAPDRRCIDSATAYGCGVKRLSWADHVHDIIKAGGEGYPEIVGNPFIIEAPDLNACAWEPDLSTLVEYGERTISAIVRAYPDAEGLITTSETMEEGTGWRASNETATVWHLETEEFIYDVVDKGEPYELSVLPNLAGRPMYTLMPGHLTSDRDPKLMFQPLVGPLYPLVQQLNIYGTLVASGALQTGRNMWQEVRQGGSQDDIISQIAKPGEQAPVVRFDPTRETLPQPRPGYQWMPVNVPDQAQLVRALQMAEQRLVQYGYPTVLGPDAPLDAKSGYDRAKAQQAASQFLDPPLANLASSWHEKFSLVADALKELGLPVTLPARRIAQGDTTRYLDSVTVKPDDFKEQELFVSFSSEDASMRFAAEEADNRNMQMGLISKATVMAKRFDDPIAEDERIKREAGAAQVEALALEDAMAIIQEMRGEMMEQAALEAGLALPPQQMQPVDAERPAGGSFPGVGSPLTPPEQVQPGEAGPVGAQAQGVAQ